MDQKKLKREDEIDKQAQEMFDNHPDLQKQENASNSYINSGLAQAETFANDPKNASQNIDDLQNRENKYNYSASEAKRRDPRSFGQKAVGFIKSKKGATTGIFGLLGLTGVVISMFTAPTLLLVHIKNIFLNDLNDATPAISIRSDRMMRNMLKGTVQARAGICTSKVTVRCKFATMSNRMEKKFKKAGFEIEGKKILGRRVISEIKYTTTDGTVHSMKNPQDLKSFAKTPEGRSALYKAFNPKTAAFLNSKFVKMLQTKFKLTKQSTEEGKNKKQVQESFDRATGADKAASPEEGGRFKDVKDKVSSLKGKLGGVTGKLLLLANICPIYETAYAISYGIKAAKVLAFTAFAYEFLKETDKLVAGDADPEVVSALGDQMTSLSTDKTISDENGDMIDNPDYSKSATDSQGYRLSAYGDTGSPNPNTTKFSLGLPTIGVMGIISTILGITGKTPGGKTTLKYFCSKAVQILGGLGAIALVCGGGSIPTGGGAAAFCIALQAAITIIVSYALGKLLSRLVSYFIDQYGPMTLGAATKGVDVGNAMAVGSGLIFGGMAQSNGMMPSKKGDLKTYFAYTDETRKDAIAANVYDAKSEPFNPYNQYSFAGGIVQPLTASFASGSAPGAKVGSLINSVTTSLASLGKAGAAYNMPAQAYDDKRYSICDDAMLKDANVDPDMLCTVRYSMSPAELDMDPDANAVYMTTHPSKEYPYVDPNSGEANLDAAYYNPETKSKTPDDSYLKFIEYCGPDRTEMIGSTGEPFDDDRWHTGEACSDKSEKMSNFRVYTMADNISTSFEEDPSAGSATNTGAGIRVATFNILSCRQVVYYRLLPRSSLS